MSPRGVRGFQLHNLKKVEKRERDNISLSRAAEEEEELGRQNHLCFQSKKM